MKCYSQFRKRHSRESGNPGVKGRQTFPMHSIMDSRFRGNDADPDSVTTPAAALLPDLGGDGDGVQRRRVARVAAGLDEHLGHFLFGETNVQPGLEEVA